MEIVAKDAAPPEIFAKPVWPQVSCSQPGCQFQDRWNRMRSKKAWKAFQQQIGDPQDEFEWVYTCKRCVGAELGTLIEEEAMAAIAEGNGTWQHKKARCDRFRRSQDVLKETYEMLGVHKTKRELHQISRSFMTQLFEELSEMLVLKARQLQLIEVMTTEHQAYITELRDCRDPVRVKELVDLIELHCQRDIPQLSFQGRGDMLYASAYSDQMTACKGGHFRYFFVCIGKDGGGTRCLSMFASKEWARLHQVEAWTPGQRWYCRCGTRYRGGNGVIVEVMRSGALHYMRAECPNEDVLDVRAMKMEKEFGGSLSPAALFARIPIIRPSTSELVSAIDVATGHFKFRSWPDYEKLPQMAWDDIFTFVRAS